MKLALTSASLLALSASTALAGGIERAANNYGLLFDSGNKIEFSLSLVNPTVTGEYTAALGGGSTGNMAGSYSTLTTTYKNQLSDKLDFGLYVNQPYGANANYKQGVYTGLRADWQSEQTAAILKYQIADRVSIFGGARYVRSRADIQIPELLVRGAGARFATELGTQAAQLAADAAAAAAAGDAATAAALGAEAAALGARATTIGVAVNPATNPLGDPGLNYTANGDWDGKWGYVLGAAYEIPDIALRVSLTWESAITHEFDAVESLPTLGINGVNGTTEITMPQSLALDFQTGIAPGTLLFGGVKWVEWSEWEVRTPGYESITGNEITGFDNDTFTYRVGVGRQFNEEVSGFAQMSYEKSNGGVASRLSPTDGRFSIGVGGQWTDGEGMKARAGIEYAKLGDATDGSGTRFEGNSAIGVGMSFSYSF